MSYEPVIGLEVHAQLQTRTKLFCACPTGFGQPPNSQACERCLGMPGILPVLNRRAIELAVRAALALNCEIQLGSQWSRKNYFYPDLPKGYQITQFDRPYALGGAVTFAVPNDGERTVRLTRIHIEEDAGKSIHDDPGATGRSYVDFNRAGTPLVEIVSKPEIRSAREAAAYFRSLRALLRALGVCDGNMQEGSLRCDANVSIRPKGSEALGTRTELKNLNSFRFLEQAVEYEISRQKEVLASGCAIVQETRLWDAKAKRTRSMRSKEEAHDYRYFPEPDLPDLVLRREAIEEIRSTMPEVPATKRARYMGELGLGEEEARILADDAELSAFFEAALARHNRPRPVANWTINEVLREVRAVSSGDEDIERGPSALPFSGEDLGELLALIDNGTISGKIAKTVFADMVRGEGSPSAIVDKKGLKQVTDSGSIEPIVDDILDKNAGNVAKYRSGQTKILGFFVGQVMKATGGKANPKLVNELLRKKLAD